MGKGGKYGTGKGKSGAKRHSKVHHTKPFSFVVNLKLITSFTIMFFLKLETVIFACFLLDYEWEHSRHYQAGNSSYGSPRRRQAFVRFDLRWGTFFAIVSFSFSKFIKQELFDTFVSCQENDLYFLLLVSSLPPHVPWECYQGFHPLLRTRQAQNRHRFGRTCLFQFIYTFWMQF